MARNHFKCLDCRIDTGKAGEYYVLKTEVWLEAHGSLKGMLCIGCLEKRLGRELTASDFSSALLNDPSWHGIWRSQRLNDRLNR